MRPPGSNPQGAEVYGRLGEPRNLTTGLAGKRELIMKYDK
jgi:hypothetical protein